MIPEKINPKYILIAHKKTLRDEATGDSKEDYFVFFGIPGIIALLLVIFNLPIQPNITNLLLTAMSISVPLLLNLLILLYDIGQNTLNNPNAKRKKTKMEVIEETCDNISFTVLVALVAVVILGFYSIGITSNHYIILVLSGTVYYLLGIFILTILMILKRTHILVSSSF